MPDRLKNVPKGLRWTDSQATAYCVLIEGGAMKQSDPAIHSDTAQGRANSIFGDLERNKGAVVKEAGRPALGKAQRPRHIPEHQIGRTGRRENCV